MTNIRCDHVDHRHGRPSAHATFAALVAWTDGRPSTQRFLCPAHMAEFRDLRITGDSLSGIASVTERPM